MASGVVSSALLGVNFLETLEEIEKKKQEK